MFAGPTWADRWAALGSGTASASSLLIGALVPLRFRNSLPVIGLIMGFGAGVHISGVAFDLIDEAAEKSSGQGPRVPLASSPAARSSSVATGLSTASAEASETVALAIHTLD